MSAKDLKEKLLELGFSDKEAAVYLALLELGAASAQDIARKSGVNRPTAYVMIESLKRRGLAATLERGKKAIFTSESPEYLLSLVDEEQRMIEEKRRRLESFMPDFAELFKSAERRSKMRMFDDPQGIRACRDIQVGLAAGSKIVRAFVHYDQDALSAAKEEQRRKSEQAGASQARVLFSVEEGIELPAFGKNVEARKLPEGFSAFKGEMDIYENNIVYSVFRPNPAVILLESDILAKLSLSLFDLAWLGAAPLLPT